MVSYIENAGPGIGTLIINGLKITHSTCDPIGKLWGCGARKQLQSDFHLDCTGLATYDDEKEVITLGIYLNYGSEETKEIGKEAYTQRFVDTFTKQMVIFEDILEAFLYDEEYGFSRYEELCKNGVSAEKLDKLIKSFLRKIGARRRI